MAATTSASCWVRNSRCLRYSTSESETSRNALMIVCWYWSMASSARARADEAMLQYQQTIINAFRDVSDSLVEYRKQREFRTQQEALVVAAVDTTRLANLRYTN